MSDLEDKSKLGFWENVAIVAACTVVSSFLVTMLRHAPIEERRKNRKLFKWIFIFILVQGIILLFLNFIT